jgi:transcriptional regulator NrdR family protein
MSKPRKNRTKRPKGFRCPHCAVPLQVWDTSPTGSGIVRRRRKCPICNHRETTEERRVAA